MSRLCMANTYNRLLCMRNPSKTLGLTPKPFSFQILHRHEPTADAEFKRWFYKEMLEKSPYFNKTFNPNLKLNIITGGSRSGDAAIGTDLIFTINTFVVR